MTPNEYAELFIKTLDQLNTVSDHQMEGILRIVLAGLAAENASAQEKSEAVETLSAVAEDMKKAIDGASKISPPGLETGETPSGNFSAEVEANLNLAMRNALNNQQQLNELGVSALSQLLARLLRLQN